jgi:murein DD-endopeptidase MepM/ murein hydrolase activator NlpD
VRAVWLVIAAVAAVAACEPIQATGAYPGYPQPAQPQTTTGSPDDQPVETAPVASAPVEPAEPDRIVATATEFAFSGGRLDFELHQAGSKVSQVMRNRYVIPVVVEWEISALVNLEAGVSGDGTLRGVVVLPPARTVDGEGPAIEVATLAIVDRSASWNRHLQFHARFGDPSARPTRYHYALPYSGSFEVLQGFHGAFSHRGSNEFAVDFDCPVATTVRAAREGLVVVTHDAAQGSGTTPDFLELSHVNFVLVLHDDGTLGEYMHLSPSGVEVQPGQRVARGQALALSGNTGFSTTPHLHFQVMTAADDGIAARPFPFVFATAADHVEEPMQGRSYASWE